MKVASKMQKIQSYIDFNFPEYQNGKKKNNNLGMSQIRYKSKFILFKNI